MGQQTEQLPRKPPESISHSLGVPANSKMKVLADSVSGEGTLPGPQSPC